MMKIEHIKNRRLVKGAILAFTVSFTASPFPLSPAWAGDATTAPTPASASLEQSENQGTPVIQINGETQPTLSNGETSSASETAGTKGAGVYGNVTDLASFEDGVGATLTPANGDQIDLNLSASEEEVVSVQEVSDEDGA